MNPVQSDNPQESPSRTRRWRILKFGGSSVANAKRIRSATEIVAGAFDRAERIGVVVSAMGGVTDQLLSLDGADPEGREAGVLDIERRHHEALESLAPDDRGAQETLDTLFAELRALLHGGKGTIAKGDADTLEPMQRLDALLSFGERLCAPLFAAALRQQGVQSLACDTRTLVRTSNRFGEGVVDKAFTLPALHLHFSRSPEVLVATGFLGSTAEGRTTTLGRGGSDLTAALLGAALSAEEIEIWTDVDGVLSADPRVVEDAFSIPALSYEEVMELAHFGAKVLYPPTVAPARHAGIPLRILNTLNPAFRGTYVDRNDRLPAEVDPPPYTGITSIPEVAMLTLVGTGMVGVTGIAHRLFRALATAECSVVLISQASSEHAICCVVRPEDLDRGCRAVEDEFALEIELGRVQPVQRERRLSVLAVVGERMREKPGVAAEVFSVLGRTRINIRAIAQGSSELNISVVVCARDRDDAVRALHSHLFRKHLRSANSVQSGEQPRDAPILSAEHLGIQRAPSPIFVAGVGGVGSEVLRLVAEHQADFALLGVANSTHYLLGDRGLAAANDSSAWVSLLREHGQPSDPSTRHRVRDALLSGQSGGIPSMFVDCTANDEIAEFAADLLQAGVSVVTANKLGVASDRWLFAHESLLPLRLREDGPERGQLGFEATVGAGLPIISTLTSLLEGGDRVLEVSGVFSGTLGFVLDRLRQGSPVSEAVRLAFDQGYTEPDPREDLSGMDVARKLLILARVCGIDCRLSDIRLEPLLPLQATAGTLEDFWASLPAADEPLHAQLDKAHSEGKSLAYLARLELTPPGGEGRPQLNVGLQAMKNSHPSCQLSGTDNLFSFQTERYRQQPLIIRGPGAGTTVTAAGVLSDLLAIRSMPTNPA